MMPYIMHDILKASMFYKIWQKGPLALILILGGSNGLNMAPIPGSDVARPQSYKTKTTYSFKPRPRPVRKRPRPRFHDQDRFFKDHQIINPRPQKMSHYGKNQASYAGFSQSFRNYAGNRKKTCMLTIGFLVKFCFIQN